MSTICALSLDRIHETIAEIDDATAEIVLTVHWTGGAVPNTGCRGAAADSATAGPAASSKRCVCWRSLPRTTSSPVCSTATASGPATATAGPGARDVDALQPPGTVYRPAKGGVEPWLNLTARHPSAASHPRPCASQPSEARSVSSNRFRTDQSSFVEQISAEQGFATSALAPGSVGSTCRNEGPARSLSPSVR